MYDSSQPTGVGYINQDAGQTGSTLAPSTAGDTAELEDEDDTYDEEYDNGY